MTDNDWLVITILISVPIVVSTMVGLVCHLVEERRLARAQANARRRTQKRTLDN